MADKTYQTTLLIRGDSKDAVRSVQLTRDQLEQLTGVQKKNATMSDQLNASWKTLGSVGKTIGVGIAAGIGLGAVALRKVVEETGESEAAMAQLNTTLKATGFAAGKSADDLTKTATALQQTTTYSDEAVLGVEDLLLKFKNIKGDNFDRTTKAVLDMATAMKIDASAAAKTIGRALEDPAKGAAKLARANVILTDSQKDTVKALVEMGDTAGAQAFLLQELENRFKGSAEAARGTLKGAMDSLQISFNDLFEVSSSASSGITDSINELNATISNPEFKSSIDTLVRGLIDVVNYSAQALAGMSNFGTAIGEQFAVAVSGVATDDLPRLRAEIEATKKEIENLASSGQGAAGSRGQWLGVGDIDAAKDKLKGLEAQLKVNLTLTSKTGVTAESYAKSLLQSATATEKFLVVTGKSGAATEKFSLIVNKSAVATKSNATATAAGSEAGLKSAGTRAKEAAAADKLAKSHETLQKRIEAVTKSTNESGAELNGMIRKTEDYIANLEYEISQTQLSTREQEINNTVRGAGTRVTEAQADQLREVAARHYDVTQAAAETQQAEEEAAAATKKAWEDARSTLSNFFFEMAADGKNAFDTLVSGFKAMVAKMAAEAAANTIILGIGAAFPGLAAAAGGTATGTSATSGGSTLLSGGINGLTSGITASGQALYESIGNFASNAGATRFGDMAYTKGLNTTGITMGADILGGFAGGYAGSKVFGETSGIGATAGGVAGSILIPVPGLGAAVGAFVGSGIEKGLGKLFGYGGNNNDGKNTARGSIDASTGKFSAAGSGNSWKKGEGREQATALEQLLGTIAEFATSIGGSSYTGTATLDSRGNMSLDGKGYNDPLELLEQGFRGVIAAADAFSPRIKEIVSGFDGTAEEIGQFAVSLNTLDKEMGGISDRALSLVADFSGANDEILNFLGSIVSIDRQSGVNTVTNAIEEFNRAQDTAAVAYETNTGLLREQISNFDGSAASAANLNNLLIENKTAAYGFATAIQTIGKALGDIAADQAASIRESILSAEDLQKKRLTERDALNATLSTLADPQTVEETTKRILELNRQIFDSLSEDQQKVQAESYAKFAENTNTVAQSILQQSLDGLKITQDDINARVSQMLDKAAQGQQQAANTQMAAANAMQSAAQKIAAAANRLDAAASASSEIAA